MPRLRGSLWCCTAGAVLFVAAFLVNDAIKPNYEPARDFVSEAAIGPGGWVQVTNFVVAGTLLAISSLSLSRTVTRWTGRLVGMAGLGLVAAGVFVSDPVPQDEATWHGLTHNIVSVIVFTSLSAAAFTAARWRPTPSWRRYCVATGIAVPVLFVLAGGVTGTSGLWQRLTIVVGWSWLAVLGLRAMRPE